MNSPTTSGPLPFLGGDVKQGPSLHLLSGGKAPGPGTSLIFSAFYENVNMLSSLCTDSVASGFQTRMCISDIQGTHEEFRFLAQSHN